MRQRWPPAQDLIPGVTSRKRRCARAAGTVLERRSAGQWQVSARSRAGQGPAGNGSGAGQRACPAGHI